MTCNNDKTRPSDASLASLALEANTAPAAAADSSASPRITHTAPAPPDTDADANTASRDSAAPAAPVAPRDPDPDTTHAAPRDPGIPAGTVLGRRAFVKMLGAGMLLTLAPLAGAATGCARVTEAVTGERQVVDDAGRTLDVPTASALERIYFTSALAQIFCFTLNPELLAGTAIRFSQDELAYLPEGSADLVYMGTLADGGAINRELLLAEDVQLVFSISAIGIVESNISDANELQDATGIPVCLVDGSMDKVAACYRTIGEIMGREDRAGQLASYCEDVFARVGEAVGSLKESEKVSLYYAEGPEGLQTEPETSQHAVVFSVAGARNVAQVDVIEGVGMSDVSLESVVAWNPDVIVSWSYDIRGGADEDIRTNPDWSDIAAVRNGRVYTMPNVPFTWLDRPPAVNRFLGVQWVANMLYPDLYDVDMVEVAKEFYSLFYWVDVSDDDIIELLGNSYPPYRA